MFPNIQEPNSARHRRGEGRAGVTSSRVGFQIGPSRTSEHGLRLYAESEEWRRAEGRIAMSGGEAPERWNNVHIPDDMPVSRILRDHVADVCGSDGYMRAATRADPCDVIGLLWGAVFVLEERLVDAQRLVDGD
jgi:hypothetical protein